MTATMDEGTRILAGFPGPGPQLRIAHDRMSIRASEWPCE